MKKPASKNGRPTKAAKKRVSSSGIACVGGVYPLPIDLPDAPGDPWVVFWVNPAGYQILGHAVLPSFDPQAVLESLLEAMHHPQEGAPRRIASVRIANHAIAEVLRANTTFTIVEASTPEVDFIADQFMADVLSPDVALTRIPDPLASSFFRAAAALYHARPWLHVPSDSALLRFSAESLGASDLIVSVIGQLGESHGMLVFNEAATYASFTALAGQGVHPALLRGSFPTISLTFGDRSGAVAPLAERARRNKWEIAGPQALPQLARFEAGVPQRTSELDVQRAIALCRGMVDLLDRHGDIQRVWTAHQPVDDTIVVDVVGQDVETRFRAPVGEVRTVLPPAVARRAKRAARPSSSSSPIAYQLRVQLDGIEPPIWRRILVPGDILLEDLHDVIQIAFGWDNAHMHQFILKDKTTTRPSGFGVDGMFGDDEGEDESQIRLSDVAMRVRSKLRYVYDFGDSWHHTIVVERRDKAKDPDTVPRCVGGELACPPEDCGGIWGYAHFCEAIANPDHPDHDQLIEWVGGDFEPLVFDVDDANRRLSRFFA